MKNTGATKNEGVSVIVCCFNSVPRLYETLRHLAQQRTTEVFEWEVLIIDNASTDNTESFAKRTWTELSGNPNFQVVAESKPGLIHARLKGAECAQFEYLVFCDDDNWLNNEYLLHAWQTMKSDAAIGAAGGRNLPATDAEGYPSWFEEYRDKYALGIPAAISGDVSTRGFVLGAGMVTRRSVFLEAYSEKYPSLLTGRNGEQLSAGEDFEYCKRLLLWNYKLHYDERMCLQHFIPRQRLTLEYRERLMKGILEAGSVMAAYDAAIHVRKAVAKKNRWRLWLLSPLRIALARLGLSRRNVREERLRQFYLSPFNGNPGDIKNGIKKFINRK